MKELIQNIQPDLYEMIELENKLYTHNQAVFSDQMCEFVSDSLTDLRILLKYFVNVVLHSKKYCECSNYF
jgi:hypothetical protein